MKKYILYLVALIIALSSCSDSEEVDIKYQVNVTVSPASVLAAYTPRSSTDLDMYTENGISAKLRITVLIYDSTGKLIDNKENELKDYSSDFNFSINMKTNEAYQIVAISSSVLTNSEKKYEAYTISNIESLDKLTITQTTHQTLYSNWAMLGLTSASVEGGSGNSYTLRLNPAVAMFVMNWNNIHYRDELGVDDYRFIFHNNDIITYKGGFSYSTSLTDIGNNAVNISPINNEGDGYYEIFYLLPTTDMHYFGRMQRGTDAIDFSQINEQGAGNLNVNAGSTYNIYYNCQTCVITVKTNQSSKGTTSSESNESKRVYSYSTKAIDLLKNIK